MSLTNDHLGAGSERHLQPGERMSRFRPRYRRLNETEIAHHDAIKAKAVELEELINQVVQVRASNHETEANVGRELALAMTKLEESVMWVVKALTAE